MTDKQIIIDGVPVQDCCYFDYENDGYKDSCYIHQNECSAQNCYYKQLKAKEQEYEELRQYHNKCCEEFEKEKKEWLEKFNQVSIGFYNGDYCNTEHCSLLRAKEQECEELKKELHKNFKEKDKLNLIIDRLLEASGYDTNTASAEDFEDVYEHMRYEQEQLDQLKAENEQLKNFHINLVGVKECEIRELARYKQAIEKIKEIANRTCSAVNVEVCDSYDSCADCGATNQYRKLMQILQICDEVNE